MVRGIYNICHDTLGDDYYSVALCSKGEYGVREGLIFSYPCQTRGGKLEIISGIEHNSFSSDKIALTERELLDEMNAVRELGLI